MKSVIICILHSGICCISIYLAIYCKWGPRKEKKSTKTRPLQSAMNIVCYYYFFLLFLPLPARTDDRQTTVRRTRRVIKYPRTSMVIYLFPQPGCTGQPARQTNCRSLTLHGVGITLRISKKIRNQNRVMVREWTAYRAT